MMRVGQAQRGRPSQPGIPTAVAQSVDCSCGQGGLSGGGGAPTLGAPGGRAFAPAGRLFVTERPGRVRIVEGGTLRAGPALTLPDVVAEGEAGVLCLGPPPPLAPGALPRRRRPRRISRRSTARSSASARTAPHRPTTRLPRPSFPTVTA